MGVILRLTQILCHETLRHQERQNHGRTRAVRKFTGTDATSKH